MFRSINILSREDMIEKSYTLDFPSIIISICSRHGMNAEFARNKNILDVCRLRFDDVEFDLSIDELDCQRLVDFVDKYRRDHLDLYIHCRQGYSRSAAVGAAIMLYEYGDDSPVFSDYSKCPNMWVYRHLLEAFNITGRDIKRARERRRLYLSDPDEYVKEFI